MPSAKFTSLAASFLALLSGKPARGARRRMHPALASLRRKLHARRATSAARPLHRRDAP